MQVKKLICRKKGTRYNKWKEKKQQPQRSSSSDYGLESKKGKTAGRKKWQIFRVQTVRHKKKVYLMETMSY